MVAMALIVFAFAFMFMYTTVFIILFMHFMIVSSINHPCAALITWATVCAILLYLRQQPAANLLGGRIARRKDCECCICFDGRTDWVLPCAHKFHEQCLADWVRKSAARTCPLCRARV